MIYSYLIYFACIAQFINQATWAKKQNQKSEAKQEGGSCSGVGGGVVGGNSTSSSNIDASWDEKHTDTDIIATISYTINVFLNDTGCFQRNTLSFEPTIRTEHLQWK